MRYDHFKQELMRAGLTVREFAEQIGVSATTVSNYATRPRVPTHFAVIVTLMAEMKENELDFRRPLLPLARARPRPSPDAHFAHAIQQSLFRESSGVK